MPKHPISDLSVQGFGPFADLELTFAPGLNIVVGDNGTGKSQLLKLLYSCAWESTRVAHEGVEVGDQPTKAMMSRSLARKLVGVFRPDSLGRLTNRQHGRARAEVSVKWKGIKSPLRFGFATNSRAEVSIESVLGEYLEDTPVFLPTRELISIYPGFVSTYNERVLEFDETWRDTAEILGRAPLRGPRSDDARHLLAPIEDVLGGRVFEERGRFYLHQGGLGNLEMHLVAEGLRKLAMIVRLVQSGTLLERGYLFWDEPEANLNPRTLRAVAKVISLLANSGVQVFVASHSLFLLRELDLLREEAGNEPGSSEMRAIGLVRSSDAGVTASVASSVADLDEGSLVALDAEMDQTSRYLEA